MQHSASHAGFTVPKAPRTGACARGRCLAPVGGSAKVRSGRGSVLVLAQQTQTQPGAAGSSQAQGHGHGHGMAGPPATGFIAEMRTVAMKLHTREQAPKEGQAERKPESKPMPQWQPTREGYLSFLVESKAVYDAMEGVMASGAHPMFAKFTRTGLERGEALAHDIAWFEAQGVKAPAAGGPGSEYANYLRSLASTDPQSFLCHWYNVYFAHTAGGRMIGAKCAQMLELPAEMRFYAWEGDLNAHMTGVREAINAVAETWSREEKDRCLAETGKSFELSGKLLRLIAG